MEQLRFSELLTLKYHCKVYMLPLDAGMGCPNRDGTIGDKGCLTCPSLSAGSFACGYYSDLSAQLEWAKEKYASNQGGQKYVVCFPSFCNTYGNAAVLSNLYREATQPNDVIGLYIVTRPDCINDGIIKLLSEISQNKTVWVELKFHTSHDESADFIRRGYMTRIFDETVRKLKAAGVKTVANMIIGLPLETESEAAATAQHISDLGVDGIKFEALCVYNDTELEKRWKNGEINLISLEKYTEILLKCVGILRKNIVIHQFVNEAYNRNIVAPSWLLDSKNTTSAIWSALKITH